MTDSKPEQVQLAPQQKKFIIIVAAVLALCVAGIIIFWLTNRGLEARIMEIFSVDGPVVSLTRGEDAVVAASAGARLHGGYGVITGEDSICHIRLDADSLMRMDSHSRVSVNMATATTLSISVEDGQVLIDVQNQYPGHELEVLIGNTAIGVRGTLFIAGQGGAADETQILMLEGSVYVDDDVPVSAGYVMTLQDDEPFEARPLSVEDLDMFAMQAVLDYRERVLEAGALTEEELAWIERLMNIPDYIWIQGVQISTAITELTICSDFTVSDIWWISPLRYRQNAFEISLTNEDIEQFAYMINLTDLTLHLQQITDITPISTLENLTYLELQGIQISDLSPLAELTNITRLKLNDAQISDISLLTGLINLTWLELLNNQISDLSPLSSLTNLSTLRLWENQISDLSPLAELTSLSHLGLERNQIYDLTPLAELANLTQLILHYNQISDLSVPAGLTNLTQLGLAHNHISDLSLLAELTNLTFLMLSHNQISDVSPLAELTNLTVLNLWGNQISDISPLAGLTNLNNLGLASNQISDITPLAGLTSLTNLQLHHNQISDITPLAGLTSLTNLGLRINQISDITPLAGLTNLTSLDLWHNDFITDWSPVAHVANVQGRP